MSVFILINTFDLFVLDPNNTYEYGWILWLTRNHQSLIPVDTIQQNSDLDVSLLLSDAE